MAPEQLRGEVVDGRADIYALGILAYELAAGVKPFAADDYQSIAEMHFKRELPPLTRHVKGIPKWYEEFVRRCAQKDPGKRYQSARAARSDLYARMVRGEIFAAKVPALSAYYPVEKKKKAKRWAARALQSALAVLGCAALAGLAVWGLRQSDSFNERASSFMLGMERKSGVDLSGLKVVLGIEIAFSDFFPSVRTGDVRKVRMLLDAGVTPNAVDRLGSPALITALRGNQAAVAALLVERGADVNVRDREEQTALMWAAKEGRTELIELLVTKGAALEKGDREGRTALMHAVIAQKPQAVAALERRGAFAGARDAKNATPLIYAANGE
ncbi:MAG TPA: ankyrin repeat domain-containing protein, partial [Oligoflexia bacterium]|nr:ankyrin repeat domain-containing protein [Oligoflexia bacterium]